MLRQGEMPLDLNVVQDDAATDAALLGSKVMPLQDYLAGTCRASDVDDQRPSSWRCLASQRLTKPIKAFW